MEIKYKQYIIINKSLGMTLGKACAMTAHSSFLALKKQEDKDVESFQGGEIFHGKQMIENWLDNGECVIVLEANSSTQMFGIQQYLERKDINNHLYIDEGLTEVPMGEPTCLATGVVEEKDFMWFEQLRLYTNEPELINIGDKDNLVTNKKIDAAKEKWCCEMHKQVEDYCESKGVYLSKHSDYRFIWGTSPSSNDFDHGPYFRYMINFAMKK